MYQLTNSQSLVIRTTDGSYIPADPENTDWQTYQQWLADGNTPEPVPSTNPIPVMVEAIQSAMDAKAHALGYDDLKTAITYRGDPNPRFAAEAEGFFIWRSSVWTEAYARMAAGNIPASPEEAVTLMPTLQITYP